MERGEETKRIRLGDAAPAGDGGTREVWAGSPAVHQDEGDGIGQGAGGNQVIQGIIVDETLEVEDSQLLSGDGNGIEGEAGEMSSLDTDLMVKVMSYLPQQDRCQSMLVNRHWEKTVREGRVLWREVTVAQKWDTWSKEGRKRGRHASMFRVLLAAEELKFSKAFELNSSYKVLSKVFGTDLKFIDLPHKSIDPTVLHSMLGNCAHLEVLLIQGGVQGKLPICIRHPKLRIIKLQIPKDSDRRQFTVDCPSLTSLCTVSDRVVQLLGGHYIDPRPPSFNFSRLTSLHLSPLHCASGVLGSIAAQCPNIRVLKAYLTARSPPSVFNLFESLEDLTFTICLPIDDPLIRHRNYLVDLLLPGDEFASTLEQVNRQHIRALRVSDSLGLLSPSLPWPSLERLSLSNCGNNHGMECLKDLMNLCPMLKSASISMHYRHRDPLELYHETLEELVIWGSRGVPKCITCPRLRLLWVNGVFEPLPWKQQEYSIWADKGEYDVIDLGPDAYDYQ